MIYNTKSLFFFFNFINYGFDKNKFHIFLFILQTLQFDIAWLFDTCEQNTRMIPLLVRTTCSLHNSSSRHFIYAARDQGNELHRCPDLGNDQRRTWFYCVVVRAKCRVTIGMDRMREISLAIGHESIYVSGLTTGDIANSNSSFVDLKVLDKRGDRCKFFRSVLKGERRAP